MKNSSWIPVGMAAHKVVIDASRRFGPRKPDCQRERPPELLMGQLLGSVALLNPGMDLAELAAKQLGYQIDQLWIDIQKILQDIASKTSPSDVADRLAQMSADYRKTP